MMDIISFCYASEEERDLVMDMEVWMAHLPPLEASVLKSILFNYKLKEIREMFGLSKKQLDEVLGTIKQVGLRLDMDEYRHLINPRRQPFAKLTILFEGCKFTHNNVFYA